MHRSSYLDILKVVLYSYMFWVTLAIVFLAGTSRVSIFCLGYVCFSFFFFWFGQKHLMKPRKKLLRWWSILIGYTFLMIFIKTGLQLVACTFVQDILENYCWVVQFASLACIRSDYRSTIFTDFNSTSQCTLPYDEAGLAWDATCFIFVIIQRCIFQTYYFQYEVLELEEQTAQASRGAYLINNNLRRLVRKRHEREMLTVEHIRRKMQKIREKQAKLNPANIGPRTHEEAIFTGYLQFEGNVEDSDIDSDSDLDLDSVDEEHSPVHKDNPLRRRLSGPLELAYAAMVSGTKNAIAADKRRRVSEHSSGKDEPVTIPIPDMGSRIESIDASSMHSSPAHHINITTTTQDTTTTTATETTVTCQPQSVPTVSTSPPMTPDDEVFRGVNSCDGASSKPDYDPEDDHTEKADGSIVDYNENDGDNDSVKEQVARFAYVTWLIIIRTIDSLIHWLNDLSKDYRCVARILKNERMKIREEKIRSEGVDMIRIELHDENDIITDGGLNSPWNEFEDMEGGLERSSLPRAARFIFAFFYALISHTELVCYFLIVLNALVSGTILSMLLPILVPLWAMLSVPRPPKNFWVFAITYTEIVVVVKYFFQFSFYPWSESKEQYSEDPFWPPRFIGIEEKNYYATFDLAVLMGLFFHRHILKVHGLWNDHDIWQKPTIMTHEIKDDASFEEDNSPPLADHESLSASEQKTPVHANAMKMEKSLESGNLKNHDQISTSCNSETFANNTSSACKQRILMKTANCSIKLKHFFQPAVNFYKHMVDPTMSAVTDVYASMFACDIITFIIVVFAWWAFSDSTNQETVANYIKKDRVPIIYLIMLLLQFVVILIDRALYLRKYIFGKFLFQIILVILVHMWIFCFVPYITQRRFVDNLPAQLWYFFRSLYFALSAYQIKCGYPTRILGNFLTKRHSVLNLVLFKGYNAVPFLIEIRYIMDWVWTDTSLSFFHWLEVEDIHRQIYERMCTQYDQKNHYPYNRGVKRSAIIKYGLGGVLLFILILIIWFPLLFMSLVYTASIPNPPKEVSVTISLGGYQPLFTATAQQELTQLNSSEENKLLNEFNRDRTALSFIELYDSVDMCKIPLNGDSRTLWLPSPPSREALVKSLESPKGNIQLEFAWHFTRQPEAEGVSETCSGQTILELEPNNSLRSQFSALLQRQKTDGIIIPHLVPRYVMVPNVGESVIVREMNVTSVSVIGHLHHNGSIEWWEFNEVDVEEKKGLHMLSFSDRISPSTVTFITAQGVLGLYVSVVLVIGRFVRMFVSGISYRIMFEELPNVDRLWKLCRDIFMVRECKELALEEDLFAKLLYLYRSPETLIKWTKLKKQ